MIVAFHNSSVDATHIDMRDDRRIFRMLAVEVDLAIEFGELPVSGAEKLVDRKSNRRMGLIESVGFVRQRGRIQSGADNSGSNNDL
jgi:hypothetical protein